jgi:hypothetical protein
MAVIEEDKSQSCMDFWDELRMKHVVYFFFAQPNGLVCVEPFGGKI